MFKWSDSDKIVIPVTVLIICIIAVGLYFLTRHRSKWVKKIPLQIISVALIGLEIAKQIYFHNNPEFTYYVLPLHFCSMILILMPLSQLFGEKVGGVFRPMAFIYSILVFILVLANPHALIGDSTSDIFGSFHNIHTYFFHFSVITYLIFSIALADYEPKYRHCINVSCGIVLYTSYAVPCAYALNTNYVNILYSYFEPLENFRLWAGQVWYNIVLFSVAVLGACALCVLTCLIYKLIQRLKKPYKEKTSPAERT